MKSNDGTAASTAPERREANGEEFVSRKLIRPTMNENADRRSEDRRNERTLSAGRVPRATSAIEQTHAETFYFQKQMQSRTPLSILLTNGETVEGIIEWYDRDAIRIARKDQANLMIYKKSIKYMYKAAEARS